jgi:metal-responsive CopG/Arc/MetJ family transcriptional regulator
MSIDSAKKPKRGRPPVDAEAVNVRLPREMLEVLDEYRRKQEDLPTRPEAIRRILAQHLPPSKPSDSDVSEQEKNAAAANTPGG